MKRLLSLCLALLMALTLVGCGEEPSPYEPYQIPWELDAAANAKETGEIHYYFMSSEGYSVDSSESDKWGDSCLIVFPGGQTMLIDCGLAGFSPLLLHSLERLGVEKLDYLIFSHPHDDHCYGGVTSGGVIDSMEIGQIYHSGAYNSGWSNSLAVADAAQRNGIPCDILRKGDVLTLGEVRMEVLWPATDVVGTTLNTVPDVNNSSLVLRFDYGEHASLFTGDIYTKAERELIASDVSEKLDADLLKLPHHGHDTSNSKEFALAVSPELSVATGYLLVPRLNYFYYTSQGGKVLMDALDGYVHVWSGADGAMEYETAHGRNTDYYDAYEYKG